MDRRLFIKTSGIGAAALAAASCAPGDRQAAAVEEKAGEMAQNYPGAGLLGFGCMRWPVIEGSDGEIDQEKVNEMVDYALAHGVNWFDSAPVYLRGKSEKATATALQRHPRESYLIATKCSTKKGNATYEEGVSMYRRSLEIYGTDHIDYYLLHNLESYDEFKKRFEDNGLIGFFLKEREAGRIRNLGFSFHGKPVGFDDLVALHERYHWDFVQIQMNYIDWQHAGHWNTNAEHMYSELDRREIPVVIMEPLLGGSLSSIPAFLADRLKEMEPGLSTASWAFRFCGSHPRVITVLSGMNRMEHLRDNVNTFTEFKPLTDSEKEILMEIAEQMTLYPLIRCTACQYCMPCEYGIDIPGLFSFYNDSVNDGTYVTNPEQKGYARAKRKYLATYDRRVESARQASHCLQCGKCLKACPQHINIPAEILRIDKYIENVRQDKL